MALSGNSLGMKMKRKVQRERESVKETKRKRARRVVEGLRDEAGVYVTVSKPQEQQEKKLLTGAHRALIDCELCCRAQPITRAPGDFSGLEHLHAVCCPIRERQREKEAGREKKN